jgi:hypothetical protein
MLLNIDKPLSKATLHSPACSFVPQPIGTGFKPVGEMGRDGGWFEVSSTSEAKAVMQKEMPSATFHECERCL